MLPLREFQKGYTGFPSLINYFGFIAEGVLLNKDGSYLACLSYTGSDMDSSEGYEHDMLSTRINHILARLGTRWMMNADAVRIPSLDYPGTHYFTAPTLQLIEAQRKQHYQQEGGHFETLYVLTFSYKPSKTEHNRKFNKLFLKEEGAQPFNKDETSETLAYFNKTIYELQTSLSSCLSLRRMGSLQLFRFLHLCISGQETPLSLPNPPAYLNYILGGYEFIGGIRPKIDENHIGVVGLLGFPPVTYSGIFNQLNTLPFGYRFSSRFIAMDVTDAEKQLTSLRTKLQLRQLSLMGTLGQMFSFGQSERYINQEAIDKVDDADDALNEAREGSIKYGYYTAVIVVMGTSTMVEQRCKEIRHILENKGFAARIESMNAVEAYLGSLPGHAYPNIRKPLIHTLNLAHMLPLTTVWAGLVYNPNPMYPKDSPPLFYAATSGTTPFRFNLHVSDVGHTLILGPTGAGKSTLLGLITAQFFRYKNAQVFSFDKGLSQYTLCKASGGEHYHILGPSNSLTFCPLAYLESDADKSWAAGWIEELLVLQGISISPKHRNTIVDAVASLEGSMATFTDFYTNLQDNSLKEALIPFVEIENGVMAGLFDAISDGLGTSRYQVFELEEVMKRDVRHSVPILTYLFHCIEKRLDGRPTLIILDEAWNMLSHTLFREKIREWLKTLRKANAAVVFATQSISDIAHSSIKDVIIESCPTKIFLPNPEATTENSKPFYVSMGLNSQQVQIIAQAFPKRQYYYSSPHGCRLIELALSATALAFTGISSPADLREVKEHEEKYQERWPAYWLQGKVGEHAYEDWLNLYRINNAITA